MLFPCIVIISHIHDLKFFIAFLRVVIYPLSVAIVLITMISVFGSITICLLASCTIVIAGGTYYEDISGNEGNTYIEGSIQLMPVINKSFYKCSISEYCKYVIKNLTNGHFSLHNNTADLPHNRTGLHIWKKINHGNTKAKGNIMNCIMLHT